jgi:hypothetical protein
MVGDVVDGRMILHESPVFQEEDSYFDLYDYSIVITLPEIIDGEYVDPTYNKNEFRVLAIGTKYSTHWVIYDIGKSYLVDGKDYSDFWDAQRDYKIRYFRARDPSLLPGVMRKVTGSLNFIARWSIVTRDLSGITPFILASVFRRSFRRL